SLFLLLALAVVFAMLASYLLSRTLVPTMVLYLLPAEAQAHAEGEHENTANRGPFAWFHEAFNRQFERMRSAYERLLGWSLDHRAATATVLLGFAGGSLALAPWIGQDFFPAVD